MKPVICCLLLLCSAAAASAAIPATPDHTIRWSGFNSIFVQDSFAIAATGNGLVVLKRPPQRLQFEPVKNILLPIAPLEQKQCGSILVVRNAADQLYFFDLSTLPDLEWLGTIDVDVPFADFALDDSTLYISKGFEGLWRYRIRNFDRADFLDSNIVGIKYADLAISGDTLLALDEYNGILFFELQDTAFAEFLDYLYIPFEAESFVKTGSELVIALSGPRLLRAQVDFGVATIIDTLDLLVTPHRLFVIDSNLLVIDTNTNYLEGIDLSNYAHAFVSLDDQPTDGVYGSVFTIDTVPYLVFPTVSGNLLMYSRPSLFGGPLLPVPAVSRYGPISGIALRHGKLFLGGPTNPLDVYDLDVDGAPTYDQTLYGGLNRIAGLTQVRDSLFVVYPQLRRSLTIQVQPDTNAFRGSIYLDTLRFHSMRFNPEKVDTLRSVFAIGDYTLGIYTISDSGVVSTAAIIQTIGTISDVELVDSILAISTAKGIWLYRLYKDFTVEFRSIFNPEYTVYETAPLNGRLIVFDGESLGMLDLSVPVDPVIDTSIPLPTEVYATAVEGNFLYAAGKAGLMVLELTGPVPSLIEYGGRRGYMIAVENGLVALSDSNAVHIWDLSNIVTDITEPVDALPHSFSLAQNYPNPFNPSTTISFTLAGREQVSLCIYNLLGQEVRTLVNEELAAGEHRIVWDGTDRSGHAAATGVYLYQLVAGTAAESRKMLLLK